MTDGAVTSDVLLARCNGRAKKFRIYGRPRPEMGDILSLPVGGRLIKARIVVSSAKAEATPSADAEAVELVEAGGMELV
jgi:hypothetical protein